MWDLSAEHAFCGLTEESFIVRYPTAADESKEVGSIETQNQRGKRPLQRGGYLTDDRLAFRTRAVQSC
jgi:hypothetical protein